MVEMVVALSLLAVSMVAISGVFFSGLKAASASATRTSAVALATRETEAIRAVPYAEMGFYDDQAGRVPSFEGLETVSLGVVTPLSTTPRLAPTGSEEVGPVTYDIRRHVSAVDAVDASTTYAEAYKKTVVILTWTDGSGPHTLRQDSIVYPGGLGPYGGSTTTTAPPAAVAPTAPTITGVAVPPDPAGRSQLDVTWSPSAAGGTVTHHIVQWSTNSSFSSSVSSSPEQPATARTYQVTGLAASTSYHFRVIAYAGSSLPSPPSNQGSGTTLATPAPEPCSVTSLTVTGTGNAANQGLSTKTYLQNGNNRLLESLNLVVTTAGACTGSFSVRSVLTSSSLADPSSPYALTGGGSTTDTGIIGATNTAWSSGVHTLTVLQAGVPVSPAVQKTFLFCAHTSSPSTNPNSC